MAVPTVPPAFTVPDDPEAINALLAALSDRMLPPGLSIRYVELATLREQVVNPRKMTEPMFTRLVENVRQTAGLESFPLCVQADDGRLDIISGHHRVRAAKIAGVTHSPVIVYEHLDRPDVVAKQLAHNAIEGTDDIALLRQLYQEIEEVPYAVEASFVTPKDFEPPVPKSPTGSSASGAPSAADTAGCQSVLFVFLPSQLAPIKQVTDALIGEQKLHQIYLAHASQFETWTTALQQLDSDMEVKAVPFVIEEMARLALRARELGVYQPTNWVPLVDLFPDTGGAVPPDVADVIRQAVDKLIQSGDVAPESAWRALEFMAAEILNS